MSDEAHKKLREGTPEAARPAMWGPSAITFTPGSIENMGDVTWKVGGKVAKEVVIVDDQGANVVIDGSHNANVPKGWPVDHMKALSDGDFPVSVNPDPPKVPHDDLMEACDFKQAEGVISAAFKWPDKLPDAFAGGLMSQEQTDTFIKVMEEKSLKYKPLNPTPLKKNPNNLLTDPLALPFNENLKSLSEHIFMMGQKAGKTTAAMKALEKVMEVNGSNATVVPDKKTIQALGTALYEQGMEDPPPVPYAYKHKGKEEMLATILQTDLDTHAKDAKLCFLATKYIAQAMAGKYAGFIIMPFDMVVYSIHFQKGDTIHVKAVPEKFLLAMCDIIADHLGNPKSPVVYGGADFGSKGDKTAFTFKKNPALPVQPGDKITMGSKLFVVDHVLQDSVSLVEYDAKLHDMQVLMKKIGEQEFKHMESMITDAAMTTGSNALPVKPLSLDTLKQLHPEIYGEPNPSLKDPSVVLHHVMNPCDEVTFLVQEGKKVVLNGQIYEGHSVISVEDAKTLAFKYGKEWFMEHIHLEPKEGKAMSKYKYKMESTFGVDPPAGGMVMTKLLPDKINKLYPYIQGQSKDEVIELFRQEMLNEGYVVTEWFIDKKIDSMMWEVVGILNKVEKGGGEGWVKTGMLTPDQKSMCVQTLKKQLRASYGDEGSVDHVSFEHSDDWLWPLIARGLREDVWKRVEFHWSYPLLRVVANYRLSIKQSPKGEIYTHDIEMELYDTGESKDLIVYLLNDVALEKIRAYHKVK